MKTVSDHRLDSCTFLDVLLTALNATKGRHDMSLLNRKKIFVGISISLLTNFFRSLLMIAYITFNSVIFHSANLTNLN